MEFLSDKPLLITDTILRDAHQSQAATRMTIEDMLPALETLDSVGYYSLECWGGATFDACMRFLNEDPWERLRTIRQHVKHTKLQMLFRGQNILGYKHYADDVVDELIGALTGDEHRDGDFCYVPVSHRITLGGIVDLLHLFRRMPETLEVPDTTKDGFAKKLYSTYLSYLPADRFAYDLKMNTDPRGSFTEIIRTADRGQFSVNVSKPGITKGQHWHHTKNEKFVVVHGHGLIQLRKVGKDEHGNDYPVVNYEVSGEKIRVVEMIPGYTHNIVNLSDTEDLVTFMWCNECFDPAKPDTYFEPVE